MADLIGTSIAQNYLKAVETSKMGTRQLAVLVVDLNTDVTTGYTDSNSLFAKAVRGLETVAEVYAIFPPSGDLFTVLVADDTLPYDEGTASADGSRNSAASDAVDAATGASSDVWNAELSGNGLNYD